MKILDFILNIIYPKRCGVCGDLISGNDPYICNDCNNKLEPIINLCPKCGSDNYFDDYCYHCLNRDYYFDKNISIFKYDEAMRSAIHQFKYGKNLNQGRSLSHLSLIELLKKDINFNNYDYILPVPIHKNRLRQRGFNQCDIIANIFSEKLNIEIIKMKRIIDTQAQSGLNTEKRMENVKDAFFIDGDLKFKNIIIIDDIFTTGSTLNSIAKTLKDKGAKDILTITLSITK